MREDINTSQFYHLSLLPVDRGSNERTNERPHLAIDTGTFLAVASASAPNASRIRRTSSGSSGGGAGGDQELPNYCHRCGRSSGPAAVIARHIIDINTVAFCGTQLEDATQRRGPRTKAGLEKIYLMLVFPIFPPLVFRFRALPKGETTTLYLSLQRGVRRR